MNDMSTNEAELAKAVAAVTATSHAIEVEKLAEIRAELYQWRTLRFNASNMRDAASFGRCDREVESLERRETALANRIARRS